MECETVVITFGWNDGRWLGGTNGVGPAANPGCSKLGVYPGYADIPRFWR